MTEELGKALVGQGGFAVLAAVLIYLGYRSQATLAKVLERVLDQSVKIETSNVALTRSIDALQSEIAGFRQTNHSLLNFMADFQVRLQALEMAKKGG